MKKLGTIVLFLVLGTTAGFPRACGEASPLPIYPVFSLADLSVEDEGAKEDLYVLLLPDDRALVLRPLSREEFASFQIQAVGYEQIEREMLAACIVLPKLDAGAISQIPRAILSVIKRAINTISGFDVFPELLPEEKSEIDCAEGNG